MDRYESQFQICAECGARCGPTARQCWMCDASLADQKGNKDPRRKATFVKNAAISKSRASQRLETGGGGWSLSRQLLMFFTIGVVGFGLTLAAPGLGVMYWIIICPAIAATYWENFRTREPGESLTLVDDLMMLAGKIVNVVFVLGLIVLAIFIALALFCFAIISTHARPFH